MPNSLINYLLKPEKVNYNLKNTTQTLIALRFVSIMDLIRERILKPTYRSLPLNFKVWYDKIWFQNRAVSAGARRSQMPGKNWRQSQGRLDDTRKV